MANKSYRDTIKPGGSLIPDTGIFNYLSDKEKQELSQKVTFMGFTRHDILFKQNMPSDHVVYVLNGLIKIFKTGRNERLICISLAGPGMFAGLSSTFGSKDYKHSSSAIENTTALMIRKEALNELIRTNGSFAASLFRIISSEVLDISDKLVNFSVKQLPGRVADLIRYFSEDVFRNNEFSVPLTRQEMAELIGTTKESLIRTLNEFKHDKIIDLEGKYIRILSPELIILLSELG
ncbi:MAG TPA: Crp/Fnr family transcriptional regulator [Bacteroidales bacterium]|nr:Crp/Fnr family transcriptional regulator [Bacteroidales bacterium]